jgi:hypothetical protein
VILPCYSQWWPVNSPLARSVPCTGVTCAGSYPVQIEAVARALGKIRVKTVTAYLQKRGWDELVEEWEAAVMRATVPPRRR